MFLLKQIHHPSRLKSCYFKSIFNNSYIFFNTIYTDKTADRLSQNLKKGQQFENKLLFNSVIESRIPKLGHKTNRNNLLSKLRYDEHLTRVLKTIRPLPISFKYVDESKTENIQAVTAETQSPENVSETSNNSGKEKGTNSLNRKQSSDTKIQNWMTSYDNYEYDLIQTENETVHRRSGDYDINYGTPKANSKVSKYPCGGCGAHLHCKDISMPGYIPSEIYKNCFDPDGATLSTILCQRCHFLKEYNIALQVRVSPEEYPNLLKSIPFGQVLVILMVDLTDFPCSVWPGIADILGPRTPIIVVGNKVDLIPKDSDGYLERIKERLVDSVKLCGFASANIKGVQLVSAKTGYGVEGLITTVQKAWRQRGDVYLIGCTNVGKSSLFNALLQSDFCKIQASDLIQRATTSPWPGTTLDLLKFPITNISGARLGLRIERLEQLKVIEARERKLRADALKEVNSAANATLTGHLDRSFDRHDKVEEPKDSFSVQGNSNLSGKTTMGIDEKHRDYVSGRWCFDTPGVFHPDTILHLLTTEELAKTVPNRIIRPETFCVRPGTSLFIAGLARLDYVGGPRSIRLTVFRSNDLPITVCRTDEATDLYKELLRSDLFQVPVNKSDRLTKWPGLEPAKSFKLTGKSKKEASYDVVLSNTGWISINCGFQEYEFQAWTPEKRGVYIRECLLPKAVTLRGPRIQNSVAYRKNKFV